MMDKFVKDFLKIGNFTPQQKDKILELCAKSSMQNLEQKIENLENIFQKKIKILENKISQENKQEIKVEKKQKNNIGKKHDPKEIRNFLLNFTNSEFIKYLTHRFNSEIPDYEMFIKKCKEEIDQQEKKYPNVFDKILERIREFAFSENPSWSIIKGDEKKQIQKGWSCQEFKNWYNQNKKHPADDDFWREEMIIPFKESVEIRKGNLPKIIDFFIKKYPKFQVETENLEQAEFYTDVNILNYTMQKIFGCISDNSDKNFQFKVKISFEKQQMNIIKIVHINSECERKSDYNFEKGDFTDLRKNLWGIGNLDIETKFEDGYFRKTILTDIQKEINKIEKIDFVEGFTYILKFY